jgi:hypothetical protein
MNLCHLVMLKGLMSGLWENGNVGRSKKIKNLEYNFDWIWAFVARRSLG